MATTALAEDRIFELARRLLEEYIAGREEYEPRISWGLFSTSGSHMRRHLHTLARDESAVPVYYHQWLAGPDGKANCGVSINGHTKPGLELYFHTKPADLTATFTAWLRHSIANAASL